MRTRKKIKDARRAGIPLAALQKRAAAGKRRVGALAAALMITMLAALLCGCNAEEEKTQLAILAAASLADVCEKLETVYEEENEGVELSFSFGGSGALQVQIEEGAPADVFISAARVQMDELLAQNLMDDGSVVDLLENKVVLIVPEGNPAGIASFEDVLKAGMIGIGEVSSVPAGQYAQEIFTSLGIWEEVSAKANFGSDVRTVLSWVETGDVDCGVVYATDAYTGQGIEIVCEAPEGTHSPVIYPAGVTAFSDNYDAACDFLAFLEGEQAGEIFAKYGFTGA